MFERLRVRSRAHTSQGGRESSGFRALLDLRSVAGRTLVVELVIVLVLVAAGVTALVLQARSTTVNDARRVTRGVAESFAHAPGLVPALDGADPSAALQPRAEVVRKATGVDSVVVFTTDSVQLTSPYPGYVGRPYTPPPYVAEHVLPQLREGRTVTFELREPAFRSITTVVPVFGADGTPKGAVSVNITVATVDSVVGADLPVLLGGAAAAVVLAVVATLLASRRLRRQTRGLGPAELARMYEHHDAVLHAVREGVVIVGGDGRVMFANDEARRLLGLPADVERRLPAELDLDPATAALLSSGQEMTDGIHQAGDRVLAVNIRPTAPFGGLPGSVVTLRDSTELHELAGRVEAAGRRRWLLYEAGMRIGGTLDMTRTCEELADVALGRFADTVAVDLLEAVTRGEEPQPADRVLRRAALRGAPEAVAGGAGVAAAGSPRAWALAGGHAVLVEDYGVLAEDHGVPGERGNAIPADDHGVPGEGHAVPGDDGDTVLVEGSGSAIVAPLRVRGGVLGLVEFRRSPENAERYGHDDLLLAEELAARAAVSVDNARRFTREHGTAEALQHSLLPQVVPRRTALEVAHRYLPAHAGVGGDWYDVIPLPGFRTALVVGDVVGHGIHAAVAMGRLRTAIRTFSALDLPPDEMLGRLDELVAQTDAECGGYQITGSTCAYAVYDPASGICTLARAGHLGPALVSPDGTVEYPETALAPPLGVGGQGHPFETTELKLDEGAHLVLFTDGLVETRERDIDHGLERLRSALSGDGRRGPEETCRAAARALPAPHPSDDVALLVARTGRLAPDQVAEWDVPMDPSAVAQIRSACARRLSEWGLDDIAFTAELILSELITNAIRYGTAPVRVRLLRDTSLFCEVSDGSSTAPHLRWAATTDEGGRGLFLVARLALRWGTRYTPEGKVIWCELPLTEGAGEGG
ncbi:SpoIIE family protein phosphatase [Streptomyces sp. NPDC048623]|uniref:SpoIIE family protein phosphatase n=1 Tax=Streptomyces sp. NPDC048623 TaxID=3155761 RepID=UPI00341BD03F